MAVSTKSKKSDAQKGQYSESMSALLTLEAMRLGVVPGGRLMSHTVGRDEELSTVVSDLEQAAATGGALRAFLGEYGVGKSHLLQLVKEEALRRHFLVSSVVLDSVEIMPAYPKRVYRSIVHNLCYPGDESKRGLAPLLDEALSNPDVLSSFRVGDIRSSTAAQDYIKGGSHLYLTPILSYLKAFSAKKPRIRVAGKGREPATSQWLEERRRVLIDFLEGHPAVTNADLSSMISPIVGCSARLYALADYRPWAKIYGYLLNGLSTLARRVGYAGLAVVLDEAEFYSLLSKQNRMFAQFLFQSWAHAASGAYEQELPFVDEELLRGGAGIQRQINPRYSDDAGLYLVFAMTPNSDGIRVLHDAIPAHLIGNLNELSDHDYQQIARKVCALYRVAYGNEVIPAALDEPLSNLVMTLIELGRCSSARDAMKFLTEFLDIVHHNPRSVGTVIKNLQPSDEW